MQEIVVDNFTGGGGHPLRPDKVSDAGVIRRNHLCVDDLGRRATAMKCKVCESRCRWGERYLELMEIPYEKQGRSAAGEMLNEDPTLTLKQRFARMRIGRIAGGYEK
ncbi:MAG: hypothetical protein E7319_02260 [Clostridiales bacterium]|nr:hypothetical protein [Clostridiales bacterium]